MAPHDRLDGVTSVVAVCRAPGCAGGPDLIAALSPVVRETPGAILLSTPCPHAAACEPSPPDGCADPSATSVRVQIRRPRGTLPCELLADDPERARRTVAGWLAVAGRWPGRRPVR